MCHPKREEIAGGEKITFESTYIIKITGCKNCKLLSYRYYSFLVIEIAKTLLRKAEILIDEKKRHPPGWRLSNKKEQRKYA